MEIFVLDGSIVDNTRVLIEKFDPVGCLHEHPFRKGFLLLVDVLGVVDLEVCLSHLIYYCFIPDQFTPTIRLLFLLKDCPMLIQLQFNKNIICKGFGKVVGSYLLHNLCRSSCLCFFAGNIAGDRVFDIQEGKVLWLRCSFHIDCI